MKERVFEKTKESSNWEGPHLRTGSCAERIFLSCPHCNKRIWVWKADMFDVDTIVCPWCYGTSPKRAFLKLEQ